MAGGVAHPAALVVRGLAAAAPRVGEVEGGEPAAVLHLGSLLGALHRRHGEGGEGLAAAMEVGERLGGEQVPAQMAGGGSDGVQRQAAGVGTAEGEEGGGAALELRRGEHGPPVDVAVAAGEQVGGAERRGAPGRQGQQAAGRLAAHRVVAEVAADLPGQHLGVHPQRAGRALAADQLHQVEGLEPLPQVAVQAGGGDRRAGVER